MNKFYLFLLIIPLEWAAFIAQLSADPQVILAETSYDFGSINQGQLVRKSFPLENTGPDPLIIEKIEFSAPGMNARVKQRVESEEKTQISITWDTSRLRRDIEGQAVLYLNDPATPQITFSLSGMVIPDIEFLPKPAFYFSQYSGENQSRSITLKNNQEQPLEIKNISKSSENFEFHLEAVEAGKMFNLNVSVKPDAPIGRFRDSLVITTTDPKHPTFHLEVNILVKPDVFIDPETVDFGKLSIKRLVSQKGLLDFVPQTLVISRREGQMRITSLSTELSFLDMHASPEEAAGTILLEVGIDPEEMVIGPITGSIKLLTDDPKQRELTIPVTGLIQE